MLEIICVVGVFAPGLYGAGIGGSDWFGGWGVVAAVAGVWVLIFVGLDIRDMVRAGTKVD